MEHREKEQERREPDALPVPLAFPLLDRQQDPRAAQPAASADNTP